MKSLSTDLAEKVLLSDIRNWIEKVSGGQTLSASARKMFLMAAVLPTISSHQRIVALLHKFSQAGRLDADELAELHAWVASRGLPAIEEASESTSDEIEKSDMPSGETKPPVTSSFTLETEGPRMVGSRVRYPKTLGEYETIYRTSERTLKRWVAEGRARQPDPDLPPFHRPSEMPAWHQRVYPQREVPAVLWELARAESSNSVPPVSTEAPPPLVLSTPPIGESSNSTPPLPRQSTIDFSSVESLGFEANVEELRKSLNIATKLWNEARAQDPPDENRIAALQKSRLATMTELRKAENDLIAYQKQHGDLVARADVRAENNRIAASIFNAVKRLVANTRPKLVGKTQPEQDNIWRLEMLACFSSLKGAKFTDPLPET